MKKYLLTLVIMFAGFLFVGCATIGRNFDVSQVRSIQIGKTTQTEIRTMFGTPWRTGVEDGKETWTYGRYHYSIFSEPEARDLVIRYDDHGTVISYTYNTTEDQQ